MKKRDLYKLEISGDAVIVYLTNGYGRQGVVFPNGLVRLEYAPYQIPKYIRKECLKMLTGELKPV